MDTRTECSTNGHDPESFLSSTVSDRHVQSEEQGRDDTPRSATTPFDLSSFELVRTFVETVLFKSPSGDDLPHRHAIDWKAVEVAVSGSSTIEQAVGRAVVIADQMSRGLVVGAPLEGAPAGLSGDDPFFAFSMSDVDADFGDESRYRSRVARRVARIVRPRRTVAAVAVVMTIVLASGIAYQVARQGPSASDPSRHVAREAAGNAALLKDSAATALTTPLAAATTTPAAAPPSLANAAPLRPHEVFGFAPYWTLNQSAGFDVSKLSTIAYFSVDVNPDGSLDESGPGWNGFQSQDLSDLVTRAHAAGDRVVLTVTCFDQSALNALTSSTSAPSTLSTALIAAIQAKNLDGVNLDFEGSGSADQAGLTRLVTQVAGAIHGANPHYQVTMDTYASSAGDGSGFYDVRALASAVDGFFVMEYQLNLQSNGSAESPLTSSMFSDQKAVNQYLAAVPASKVILGLPYFGIDWPTTDGTLTAQAAGPATQLAVSQITSNGHPVYWDATTSTAWTSYEVGAQWHETFFEDPTSLYDAAQLASTDNLAGVGIWALGMDGNNPDMLSALLGFSPAVKDGAVGPSSTTPSGASPSTTSTSAASTTTAAANPPTTIQTTGLSPATSSTSTTTASTTVPSSTTTTATTAPSGPQYEYTGTWNGQTVVLTAWTGEVPAVGATVGQLSAYATTDPATSCLTTGPTLTVEPLVGEPGHYLVVATEPTDCANASFTFSVAT